MKLPTQIPPRGNFAFTAGGLACRRDGIYRARLDVSSANYR